MIKREIQEANGSMYITTRIKIVNTEYDITVVKGRYNYVSVRKITANPFGGLGKQFKDFNEATRNYKNPTMKVELLKIELGLNDMNEKEINEKILLRSKLTAICNCKDENKDVIEALRELQTYHTKAENFHLAETVKDFIKEITK